MMKILGAVLVCGSCTVWGVSAWQQLQKRLRAISAMLTALDYMMAELEYQRTPLPEMVQALAKAPDWITSWIFRTLETRLCENTDLSFPYQWCRTFAECREPLGLQKEEMQLMQDAATYLGKYDVTQQVEGLRRIRHRLQTLREEAREEVKSRGKLYRSCGFAAGAVIALALL